MTAPTKPDPQLSYWTESVSIAMEEAGISFTPEQAVEVGGAMQGSHDNYGMAFYSPPASDRTSAVETELKKRIARLQRELDEYQIAAEKAVKQIGNMRPDANISINKYGQVQYHG